MQTQQDESISIRYGTTKPSELRQNVAASAGAAAQHATAKEGAILSALGPWAQCTTGMPSADHDTRSVHSACRASTYTRCSYAQRQFHVSVVA